MVPIFLMTVRSLVRGRRLLAVAALLAIPVLVALAYLASGPPGSGTTPTTAGAPTGSRLGFVVTLVETLVVPLLLPLTALLFATSALGDEVEDRTLVYLVLRPVARLTLVLAKVLAAALLTVVMVELSLAATYGVVVQGAAPGAGLTALLLAGLGGSLAYSSVFLLLGLLIPRRALLAGFLYVLIWEGAGAGISTALATLTVRRYVEGVLHAGLTVLPASGLAPGGIGGPLSAAVLAGIAVAGVALTTWSLRRIQLP